MEAESFADSCSSVEGPNRGSSESVGRESCAMRKSKTTPGALTERPESEESMRPDREKRPLRGSKAASPSRDLGDTAEVAQKQIAFNTGPSVILVP